MCASVRLTVYVSLSRLVYQSRSGTHALEELAGAALQLWGGGFDLHPHLLGIEAVHQQGPAMQQLGRGRGMIVKHLQVVPFRSGRQALLHDKTACGLSRMQTAYLTDQQTSACAIPVEQGNYLQGHPEC